MPFITSVRTLHRKSASRDGELFRWRRKEGNREVGVMEIPPGRVRIRFSDESEEDHGTGFTLLCPWVYLMVLALHGRYHRSGIFFSRQRLKDTNDPGLRAAPLPNHVYWDKYYLGFYGCCLGYSPKGGSLARISRDVRSRFFATGFNTGIAYVERELLPRSLRFGSWRMFLKKWEVLSEKGTMITGLRYARGSDGVPIRTMEEACSWILWGPGEEDDDDD